MERRAFLISTGALAAIALVGCAGQPTQTNAGASGMRFSEAERATIKGFYAQRDGRQSTGPVPTQRAKAGDVLDSGQRPNRLPDALNQQLTHLPEPYARLLLGADVILVNRNTHDILDVIPQIAY